MGTEEVGGTLGLDDLGEERSDVLSRVSLYFLVPCWHKLTLGDGVRVGVRGGGVDLGETVDPSLSARPRRTDVDFGSCSWSRSQVPTHFLTSSRTPSMSALEPTTIPETCSSVSPLNPGLPRSFLHVAEHSTHVSADGLGGCNCTQASVVKLASLLLEEDERRGEAALGGGRKTSGAKGGVTSGSEHFGGLVRCQNDRSAQMLQVEFHTTGLVLRLRGERGQKHGTGLIHRPVQLPASV